MNRTKQTLLSPGPINVTPAVSRGLTSEEICHREVEFEVLLRGVSGRLLEVAGLDATSHAAVVVTGSGSAANESVLSSVVPRGGRVLVISNGEFGERLAITSEIFQTTDSIRHGWNERIDLARVEEALSANHYDLVAMVHHETSSGRLNPVEAVAALCQKHNTQLFVDAVSSFSADELNLKAPGISFMTTSAGKALAAYPGVSVVIGRISAFDALENVRAHSQYLDLHRHYCKLRDKSQTPNTPAVPLFLALDAALVEVLTEGTDVRMARLRHFQRIVRKNLQLAGFTPLLSAAEPQSCLLTTAWIPDGVGYDALKAGLREEGYIVYGGKGEYEGRVIQVATLGTVDEAVLTRFFVALNKVMLKLHPGSALRSAI